MGPVSPAYLRSVGFVESKRDLFVLYRDEVRQDERGRWRPTRRKVGEIQLSRDGSILRQVGFPEGVPLYRRIIRPWTKRVKPSSARADVRGVPLAFVVSGDDVGDDELE